MDFISYVVEEGLVMVPALFILGEVIKHTNVFDNRFIPAILAVISLLLTPWLLGGFTAVNVVQAILVLGAAVLTNEVIDQYVNKKGEK